MKLECAPGKGKVVATSATANQRPAGTSNIDRTGSNLVAFHLLGDRVGLPVETISQQPMRPALFAEYRDLSKLRFDFPLVLIDKDNDKEWVRSLADTIDSCLENLPQEGLESEEIRRQILNQEHEIRLLVRQGKKNSLSSLWEEAEQRLLANASEKMRATLEEHLDNTGAKLKFDGQIIDFDEHISKRLITHAWHKSQRVKSAQLGARVTRLTQKLSDILRVDYLRSSEARDAGQLKKSLGAKEQAVFNFEAMAQILKSAPAGESLPERRQTRIKSVIAILESQRFVATSRSADTLNFSFASCTEAEDAYRERLPAMADLVKAISIAELEIENRYEESRHDTFYELFDQDQLGPSDLSLFPSYLVYLRDESAGKNDSCILEILRKGLPFKIIAQSDNIVGDLSTASGQLCFGTHGQQLASMALGLNNVFVLQSAASTLYQLRKHIMQGLVGDQPALFSIYSGAHTQESPYLIAAAASESRTFPSFVYNSSSGENLAEQFHLDSNPFPDQGWRKHLLKFVDYKHKDYSKDIAFTPIDFIYCDGRFTRHFAFIPKANWTENMVMVDAYLNLDAKARKTHVPYILLIDRNNALYRAVCNIKLIEASNRCSEQWRRLQEFAGFNSAHVTQALNNAKKEWEAEKQQLLNSLASAPATTQLASNNANTPVDSTASGAAQKSVPPETAHEEAVEISSDDPWIETVRCTTCNECTTLNARMFGYNEDKRAYIADPDAGTFRELVEAAENCQVAIIHPGKPRNPDEGGLEELIARAEPFMRGMGTIKAVSRRVN